MVGFRFLSRQVHWKIDLIEQLTTQSSHRGLGQLVCVMAILTNRN